MPVSAGVAPVHDPAASALAPRATSTKPPLVDVASLTTLRAETRWSTASPESGSIVVLRGRALEVEALAGGHGLRASSSAQRARSGLSTLVREEPLATTGSLRSWPGVAV